MATTGFAELTRAPGRRRLPPGGARLHRRLTPLASPCSPGPYYSYCSLRPGAASSAPEMRVFEEGEPRRSIPPARPLVQRQVGLEPRRGLEDEQAVLGQDRGQVGGKGHLQGFNH